MSLLKDALKEIAAAGSTGATAVAGHAGSLFSPKPAKKKKTPMIRRIKFTKEGANHLVSFKKLTKEGTLYDGGILNLTKEKAKGESRLQYLMGIISEDITGATDFDAADVVSKLEAAEKKAKLDRDTVTFGLKDEDDGIVQVYVPKDQAEEFEYALSHMLANSDYNSDKENTSMEIAEVLFKLKDRFDIVDVDWGEIPEDEEQEQTVGDAGGAEAAGEQGAQGGEENPIDQAAGEQGAQSAEGDEGSETNAGFGGDEEAAKSALDSVIDMMKMDAKAKAAEAEARAAEARAREAEWAAIAASHKIKQEEEILDMETHEKNVKDQEKEAKRLAKLAKYQHDKAAKYSGKLHGSPVSGSSEEEESGGNHIPFDPAEQHKGASQGDTGRVSLEQLRDLIFYHLRGNSEH